jgi:hypothetical protein
MANDAMPLLSFFGERMNEIGSDQEPSFVSLDASVLSHPNKISDFSGGVAGVEGPHQANAGKNLAEVGQFQRPYII